MHNIKLIRANPDLFLKKLSHRNSDININSILDLDKKNRDLIQDKEKLEQEKKIISQKKNKNLFDKSKEISLKINQLNNEQMKIKNQIEFILASLPSLGCPYG